jgi:hypothetical protein
MSYDFSDEIRTKGSINSFYCALENSTGGGMHLHVGMNLGLSAAVARNELSKTIETTSL